MIPPSRLALALAFSVVCTACATGGSNAPGLAGRWTLDPDRTAAVQPDNSRRRGGSHSVHATVAVGGVPLPGTGGWSLPEVAGTARDPRVLHATDLTIEPGGDALTLVYDGGARETLQRGDDQGLVSDWSRDKLTSGYETTSRSVSSVYQLQRDGSLLVTVRLDPNQGPAAVYKRVFNRVTNGSAP